MTFGEKVLFLRGKKGLSQKALGKEIGVSDKTVGKYETKGATPRKPEILENLANLFGMKAKDLMDDSIDIVVEEMVVDETEKPVEEQDMEAVTEFSGTEEPDDIKDEVSGEQEPDGIEDGISDTEEVDTMEEEVSEEQEPDGIEDEAPGTDEPDITGESAETKEAVATPSIPMPEPPEPEPASAEAIRLVSRLSVLLAGSRLSKAEKDAVMISLNGAYWSNR